ncbi:MAG: FAD-dependent oxidoreductase [Candidatus Thiodiazotropha sp. (ex Monitilora ramsayi)]|nr:FAD-dependent oxidoreductase [Candidatus Thiodiazotropha sp. (ex Monitilora ramsayi)]
MPEHYDVVVVGGGIHGVGVAQAAACAGHSVLLLEKNGLAAGTSSRSSKLIHGGLRYLEDNHFGLVRENLQERTILLKIAPELVRMRSFHIPVYPETTRRPLALRAGLMLYAVLSGFGQGSHFRKLRHNEWGDLDGLETQGLQAVYQYHDAQTDDAALTRAVMRSAERFGAELVCPAEFLAAQIHARQCEVQYRANGVDKHCTTHALVNAGGPWVDSVDSRISPSLASVPMELVQGTHLILEGPLSAGCYYMEAPCDHRAVFLLPWGNSCMLGTTEKPYTGNPAGVHPLDEEISYLLDVLHHYFPQRPDRIIEMFSGLRVLPLDKGAAFSRSRETTLSVDRESQPRVVSIYGGKLSGYRATAQKVMQCLANSLPQRKQIARTSDVTLVPVD